MSVWPRRCSSRATKTLLRETDEFVAGSPAHTNALGRPSARTTRRQCRAQEGTHGLGQSARVVSLDGVSCALHPNPACGTYGVHETSGVFVGESFAFAAPNHQCGTRDRTQLGVQLVEPAAHLLERLVGEVTPVIFPGPGAARRSPQIVHQASSEQPLVSTWIKGSRSSNQFVEGSELAGTEDEIGDPRRRVLGDARARIDEYERPHQVWTARGQSDADEGSERMADQTELGKIKRLCESLDIVDVSFKGVIERRRSRPAGQLARARLASQPDSAVGQASGTARRMPRARRQISTGPPRPRMRQLAGRTACRRPGCAKTFVGAPCG